MARSQLLLFTAMVSFGAAPVAAKIAIQPGLYEMRSRITAISGPGLGPAQIRQILAGPPEVRRQCVTPEAVADGSWYDKDRDERCASKDASTGGRIDIVDQCPDQASMRFRGTHTSTALSATLESTTKAGKMTASISAKRLGDCTGNDE